MLNSEQQKSDMWPWGPAETWWWRSSQGDVQPAQALSVFCDAGCTVTWAAERHFFIPIVRTENGVLAQKTKCHPEKQNAMLMQAKLDDDNLTSKHCILQSTQELLYYMHLAVILCVVFMNTFCLYLCCFLVIKLFHAVVSADYSETKPIASTSLFYCVLQVLYDAAHCCRDYKFANKPPAAL